MLWSRWRRKLRTSPNIILIAVASSFKVCVKAADDVEFKASCDGTGLDNTWTSNFTCWLEIIVLLICIALLYITRGGPKNINKAFSRDESTPGRFLQLDFARCAAVLCVIMSHANGGDWYVARNVGFVIGWVMQFLNITSGICFSLSKLNYVGYASHPFALALLGMTCNFLSLAFTQGTTDLRPFEVMHQMHYAIALGFMAWIAGPLRDLHRVTIAGNITARTFWPLILYGGLVVIGFAMLLSRMDTSFVEFEELPIAIVDCACSLFLASLSVFLQSHRFVVWILFWKAFVLHIAIPYQQAGIIHQYEWFLIGMMTHANGIWGEKLLRRIWKSTWPFWFALWCGLSLPLVEGRCDLVPPPYWPMRLSLTTLEHFLCLIFLIGGLGVEDSFGLFPEITEWSLMAYVFHYSVILVIGTRLGIAATYISLAIVGFRRIGITIKKESLTHEV